MSISLQKGQKISLSKGDQPLTHMVLGLGWDEAPRTATGFFAKKPAAIDCDAAVIVLRNGKFVAAKDLVYFGNLRHESDGITHLGDNLTGEGDGDDEQIVLNLNNVPADVDRMVIVVTIYSCELRKQNFGMIRNAFVRIVDSATQQELMRYNLTNEQSDMTAMIFGEVYRNGGAWKFSAVGQGLKVPGIKELVARYK